MPTWPIDRLEPWDGDGGALQVVIETPKSSRNKYTYDPEKGLFKLKTVLPLGDHFPFDFGFVPGTRGDDGDPIDVLVLMDEPAFSGCLISGRLIGAIEAKQTEDGETIRNDRLVAVAANSRNHQSLHSLKELESSILDEIEHFFKSYDEMEGKKFRPLGRYGPRRAQKLIESGIRRHESSRPEKKNGQQSGRRGSTPAGQRKA
jgi:inorganic pyrophosphatase